MNLALNKAFDGCAQSALLWHKLFSSTMLDVELTLNPCNSCASNKIFDGNEWIVVWHADDKKITLKI